MIDRLRELIDVYPYWHEHERLEALALLDAERAEHEKEKQRFINHFKDAVEAKKEYEKQIAHLQSRLQMSHNNTDRSKKQVADLQQRISDLKVKSCPYHAPSGLCMLTMRG
jgi:phage shock protein A